MSATKKRTKIGIINYIIAQLCNNKLHNFNGLKNEQLGIGNPPSSIQGLWRNLSCK